MKKIIYLYFLALMPVAGLLAQNPNNWDTAWAHSFGGPSIDYGRDLKETSDKGFIIAGTTSTFGQGSTSFYIIKTDSNGTHQWSKALGTGNNDVAYSVDIASDGGYFFAGTTNNNSQAGYDGYLIKTNSQGIMQWTKNYGWDDWDFFYNSCLMPDGGLVLCGETYSDTKGGADAYIVRTNTNGDTLWTRKLGTAGDDALYKVAQKNSCIYAVGQTYDTLSNKSRASIYKLDMNGNTLALDTFLLNNIENTCYYNLSFTSNGKLLLCGKRQTDTSTHYILRKVDTSAFNPIYYITSSQASQSFYMSAVVDGNNNDVYTLATNYGGLGGLGAFYIRFDAGFSYLNSANFGGAQDEQGYEMIRTSRGYAFIGSTKSYGNQNNSVDENVYLVVFNKNNLVNDYYVMLDQFQDTLTLAGINENKLDLQRTVLYPNPVLNTATILFPTALMDGKTLALKIYDSNGCLVSQDNVTVTDKAIGFNRQSLKAGNYYYRLQQGPATISLGRFCAD